MRPTRNWLRSLARRLRGRPRRLTLPGAHGTPPMPPTRTWLRSLARRLGGRPRRTPLGQPLFRPRLDLCESREATNTLLFGGLLGVGMELPLGNPDPLPFEA